MDTESTSVKKPKTLPKPILDARSTSSATNNVNQAIRSVPPHNHEGSKDGKQFLAAGQKPPLLPKPMYLKKPSFSPSFKQNKVIEASPYTMVATVTSKKSTDNKIKLTRSNSEYLGLRSDRSTEERNFNDVNELSTGLLINSNLPEQLADFSKNNSMSVDDLTPIKNESQVYSIIENSQKISEIDKNDNIQSNVEQIVVNTWVALQEGNAGFCNYVNNKTNSQESSVNCNTSNINIQNQFLKTISLKESTCLGEKNISAGQRLHSVSKLVESLHLNKVDSYSELHNIVDSSRNDSFLYSSALEDNLQNEISMNGSETVSPVLLEEGFSQSLDNELNAVVIDKYDKSNENVPWSEGNVSVLSRSNSVGSGSYEGPPSTVRRRISSWFGSFGKGNKQREMRESSLFYYDSPDTSVNPEKSNEDINTSQGSINDTNEFKPNPESKTGYLKVPSYLSSNFDDDSNRSSISDESFETKLVPKLNTESKSVETTVQNLDEKHKQKCFFIVKELVSSEKVFIDVLKLLCVDFKRFIEDIGQDQKNAVIPPNEFNKITNSLPQLLSLNEDLLRDLESRVVSWDTLPKIADVIVKKGPFLKLYSTYIQNFQAQSDYLDDCCQKYPRFLKAVRDFESSDRCKKLALKHYMLKPVQRIPQYRLLLEDYLEHLEEGSIDYVDTKTALQIVSDVATHANKSIKQGDHLSKLLSIQSQLGNYEIIKPGREFIMEGELYKLSRKETQLRFFILLSDCLLYTSYYGSMTGLRVRNKLPLCGMKVFPAHDKDSPTEFSIISSTRSFTLRAKTEEESEAWINALQNAIKEVNNRKNTFIPMNFVPMNAADEPLKLGREAPLWIPDSRVTMCQVCTAEFTVTFRRHHCRACGKVVCGVCSVYKAPLMYKEFQPNRVCEDCFDYLFKELDDPSAKLHEVIQDKFNLIENADLMSKIDQIRSSFKKPGPGSGKKIKKYIPQRLKEVTANDTGSQISGWLYRQSPRRSWKRLWFVLKEQVLYVYKASEDVVALESIPVLGYSVDMFKEGKYEDSSSECRFVFQLTHAGQDPFVFGTDTQHSAERWISAIQDATQLK